MVRDPSIVSPSLTGVFIGGVITNTVQDRGRGARFTTSKGQGADDGLLRSRRPRHVVVEEAAQEKKSRALLLTVEKNGADQEGAVLGVLGEGRQRGLRDRLPT